MEDMSKKGKRLEKDNDALKRQKEATAANIIRMAEERQEYKRRAEEAEMKVAKMLNIIQAMQEQGRKLPRAPANSPERKNLDVPGDEADESDYSEEEGEDEELSEFDDDTEEETQANEQGAAIPYGPERPPQPVAATTNGH